MASQVEIINRSLIKLGGETISSPTEEAAIPIVVSWNSIRKDELARYPWNFAKKTSQLAASTTAPLVKWARKFRRQSDDLRIVEIGEDQAWAEVEIGRLYDLQGREILTDLGSPLNVTYVADITNTGEFDPAFSEALAARLAAEHCLKITGSTSLLPVMEQWYDKIISAARSNNAIQLPPRQIGGNEPWLVSRRGFRGYDRGWLWRS